MPTEPIPYEIYVCTDPECRYVLDRRAEMIACLTGCPKGHKSTRPPLEPVIAYDRREVEAALAKARTEAGMELEQMRAFARERRAAAGHEPPTQPKRALLLAEAATAEHFANRLSSALDSLTKEES